MVPFNVVTCRDMTFSATAGQKFLFIPFLSLSLVPLFIFKQLCVLVSEEICML